MKILFIGNFTIHSYARHWCGIQMAAMAMPNIEAMFHDFRKTGEGVTVARIAACEPDVVVFCVQDAMTDMVLDVAKDVGAFTALWFCDLREPVPRDLSSRLNMLAMTNTGWLGKYCDAWRLEANNAIYLPQGCLPRKEIPAPDPVHSCDILHIGSQGHPEFHAERRRIFAMLCHRFGRGFRMLDPHSNDEKAEVTAMLPVLYASAKLSIGISEAVAGYHSNRLFLAIGNGAFYFCNHFPGIEVLFEPGKEVSTFGMCEERDVTEAVEVWLSDAFAPEREKIRAAGFARAKAEHTYPHRVNVLMDEIGKRR